MKRACALLLIAAALLASACGGDDPDDREQIEDVTNQFFEGLAESDCDTLSDSLAEDRQIPEGLCLDFVQGLEDGFAGTVSQRLGGNLDEFELGIESVRAIDLQGDDDASASVLVHLNFGADGDLSDVFEVEGADGRIEGEVNIPTEFLYVQQDGDWKISEPFRSAEGEGGEAGGDSDEATPEETEEEPTPDEDEDPS